MRVVGVVFAALASVSALKLAPRRAVLGGAIGAGLSAVSLPAFAIPEELKAKVAAREAAEKEAKKPFNKLKNSAAMLKADVADALYEQQWDQLRGMFESSPLSDVKALTGPVPEKNGAFKSSTAALRTEYLNAAYAIQMFAYTQQKNAPVLRGCAMVREPKNDLPSCFVNIDAPTAELKKAQLALDKIVALANDPEA